MAPAVLRIRHRKIGMYRILYPYAVFRMAASWSKKRKERIRGRYPDRVLAVVDQRSIPRVLAVMFWRLGGPWGGWAPDASSGKREFPTSLGPPCLGPSFLLQRERLPGEGTSTVGTEVALWVLEIPSCGSQGDTGTLRDQTPPAGSSATQVPSVPVHRACPLAIARDMMGGRTARGTGENSALENCGGPSWMPFQLASSSFLLELLSPGARPGHCCKCLRQELRYVFGV